MSSRLKPVSGKEVVKKLRYVGWTVDRQVGSHVMMIKPDYRYTLSIPQHKELGLGLLRKIIKQAGLTVKKFNQL